MKIEKCISNVVIGYCRIILCSVGEILVETFHTCPRRVLKRLYSQLLVFQVNTDLYCPKPKHGYNFNFTSPLEYRSVFPHSNFFSLFQAYLFLQRDSCFFINHDKVSIMSLIWKLKILNFYVKSIYFQEGVRGGKTFI